MYVCRYVSLSLCSETCVINNAHDKRSVFACGYLYLSQSLSISLNLSHSLSPGLHDIMCVQSSSVHVPMNSSSRLPVYKSIFVVDFAPLAEFPSTRYVAQNDCKCACLRALLRMSTESVYIQMSTECCVCLRYACGCLQTMRMSAHVSTCGFSIPILITWPGHGGHGPAKTGHRQVCSRVVMGMSHWLVVATSQACSRHVELHRFSSEIVLTLASTLDVAKDR